MRFLLLLAAPATLGCAASDREPSAPPTRTGPPAVVAVASGAPEPAPPVASATPAAPAALAVGSCDDASARIRALDEAKQKLADGQSSLRCSAEAGRYTLSLGNGPDDGSELVFLIDAKSGAISVDADRHAGFTRGHPLSLDDWREEESSRRDAAAKVFGLPEVQGWGKGLEAAKLSLGFWAEGEPPKKGCAAGDPDCAWSFYVGEIHPDHAVRRITILVDRTSGAISVADLGGEVTTYAQWKKTATARLMRAGK